MSANTGWVKQDDVGREAWKFLLCEDKRIYGYVSNYSDAIDMWSWQARQGDYWLCELAPIVMRLCVALKQHWRCYCLNLISWC